MNRHRFDSRRNRGGKLPRNAAPVLQKRRLAGQRTGQHHAVQPLPVCPVSVGLVVFDPRAPHSVPEPTRLDTLRMLGERACTERR